jgi:hypothetical protein
MSFDLIASMKTGISNSKVMLACLNSTYQSRENCMFELKEAHSTSKPIISLIIEENAFEWISDEAKTLCKLNDSIGINDNMNAPSPLPYLDLSDMAKLEWDQDETNEDQLTKKLYLKLKPLLTMLNNANCPPSLT